MEDQRDKLQELYKSGVLTKEEMEAELKKIQAPKNQKMTKSCSSCMVVLFVIIAIVCAIATYINNNKEETTAPLDPAEISAILASDDGSLSDRMTADGKHLLLFDLGEFTDINNYTNFAQKALKGEVHFYVCPTKDGKKIAVIKIDKFHSRLSVDITDTTISEYDIESMRFVGPTIFDSGRPWLDPFKENSRIAGWQPCAEVEQISLTPKAVVEAKKLLKYIEMGKISESEGDFYAGGRQLTEDEISDMVKFGMLTKKHWYSKPEIVEDYNRAIDITQSSKNQ